MKYRSGSWLKSVLHNKKRFMNTGSSMKNWTKSVKLSTMKTKCSRTNSTIWISLSNRNTKLKKTRTQNSVKKFKNGNRGIRLVKKVRPKSLKILEIWCRVKENRWLIDKSERWPYVSRMKGQGFKTKSESAENY